MSSCSVLVPAYNVERYVAQAVESALAQTYPDFEVIVVNDGSTDKTAHRLTPYLDRVTYIEQENRGLSSARNAALSQARGDYVALLDADDVWFPDRLETMISYLENQSDLGFATSDSFLIYGEQMSEDRFYETLPIGRRFQEEDQEFWICQYDFVHVMVVCKKELFQRHGEFDETLRACEDWDMWIRFIQGGERVGFVDKSLGGYRLRPGSLSIDKLALSTHELQVLEKAANRKWVRGLRGRLSLAKGRLALMAGRPMEAASLFGEAARDGELDLPTRAKALGASLFPRLSWATYRRLLDKRRERWPL